ncbi:MAG: hypothetical protein KF812_07425 [Fimbriimonadaceae bacterium]|nr:hypothetical protein [Fimbriimonadaceae bacterium]
MRSFVEWATRRTWGWLLWLNRRPWMRIARRRAAGLEGRPGYERARANILAQERFARRHGRSILRVLFWILVVSITFQLLTWLMVFAMNQGWFRLPQRDEILPPE